MTKTEKRKTENKKRGCCFSCCCGGCCCSCCRSDSLENGLDRRDGPDDEAHITGINTRQPEGEAEIRNRKKNLNQDDVSGQGEDAGVKCRKCCKSVTAFTFSHIGLCCLVVAYSIMGGFLFQMLESDSEATERIVVKEIRKEHLMLLWNVTDTYNVLDEVAWKRDSDVHLKAFQNAIFVAIKDKGWDGREGDDKQLQWSFAGSLLYSITVITTIGYGHIAPKTEMGRLFTMFYALVGIPLTLLCLANIGSFFGNCFRFLYKHVCSGLVWLCCPNIYNQPKTTSSGPAEYAKDVEEAIAVMSADQSVGPAKGRNKKTNKLEKQNSFHNGTRTNQKIQQYSTSLSDDPESTEALRQKGTASSDDADNTNSLPSKDAAIIVGDESGGGGGGGGVGGGVVFVVPTSRIRPAKKHKKTLKEEVRVPMLVSLMIIALYIFGGAVLFSVWEKDWDYLIGSYFCFITLSTIGFGDFVFGTGEWNDNSKLIICACYLFFGLSIIAMGFDLMQEEVRAKFFWLGTKLGLIDKDDEENEENM